MDPALHEPIRGDVLKRTWCILMAAGCLASCGPDDDDDNDDHGQTSTDAGQALITLAVSGHPQVLQGVVTVDITAEPAGAFYGIEVKAGDTKLGNVMAPPYALTWDTRTFADGQITVTATGQRLQPGLANVVATLQVELANHVPVLRVVDPVDGAVVVGSAHGEIRVRPLVQVEDGNGVQSLTCTAGGEPVALHPGVADVDVPLVLPTREFPANPVALVFTVVDNSGQTATTTVTVQPSLESVRYLGWQGLTPVEVVGLAVTPTGKVLIHDTLGALVLLDQPGVDATPILEVPDTRTALPAMLGDALFFMQSLSFGTTLVRVEPPGQMQELLLLRTDENRYWGLGPQVVRGSTVLGSWQGQDGSAHVLAYQSNGTQAWEKVLADTHLEGSPVEDAEGRLFMVTSGTDASACVKPVLADWSMDGCWTVAEDRKPREILLMGSGEIVVRLEGPAENGPPASGLGCLDSSSGNVKWSFMVPNGFGVYRVWRHASGDVLAWITSPGPDQPATLKRIASNGQVEDAWQGEAGWWSTLWALLPNGHAVVSEYNVNTTENRLSVVIPGAATPWTLPLGTVAPIRIQPLDDNGVTVISGPAVESGAGTWRVINVDGTERWTEELPAGLTEPQAVVNVDGVLVLPYFLPEQQRFILEGRSLSSGALQWRSTVANAHQPSYPLQVVLHRGWNSLLVSVPMVETNEAGEPTYRSMVLGVVP